MTAERVDAVIAAVERHDQELASLMGMAAGGLTAGEGEEVISQASLQVFLWYEVPREFPNDTWRPLVEAAAVLLSLLGLDRYAAIARSPTTAQILEAWERGRAKGFARFRAAQSSSGVEPPDTELLEWGELMGMAEVGASAAVEKELERAIIAGDLHPGKGSWRRVAVDICDRTLLASAARVEGMTRLESVLDERVEAWIRTARPDALKAWRGQARDRWAGELAQPDVAAAVAPMRWLLETCLPGVTLTPAGYLPPALAREASSRFGWWEWSGQPRTEADVHQIGVLRETAARLHLVSKQSRKLALTRRGIGLLNDAVGLWRAIASTLACEDEFTMMVSELVAHRLSDGPAVDDALEGDIGLLLEAQGWTTGGERITAQGAAWAIHGVLYHWRLFGLLGEVRPRWEGGHQTSPSVTALNAIGRSTAIALLRARATSRRTDPRA